MIKLREFVLNTEYFIVAHRGSSSTAPENTIAAFSEAIQVKTDMVEADIQLTSDDKIVSFHDKSLGRTSNGKGLISDYTYDEIKDFDAGSWFNPKFAREKIPLLSDVIALIKEKLYLNIEIKILPENQRKHQINKILEIILESKMDENTLFSSFDYNALKEIKSFNPKLPTAAIRIPGDKRLPSEIASEIGTEAFVCSRTEISEEIYNDAQTNNIFIGVYSIDTLKHLTEMLKYPIKAIVTNNPARIKKHLASNIIG